MSAALVARWMLAASAVLSLAGADSTCPIHCRCVVHSQREQTTWTLDCSFQGLSYLPGPMPSNVTHLQLSGNSLRTVHSLMEMYLPSLLFLNASRNLLYSSESFRPLSSLHVLDLSFNRLRSLSKAEFAGLSHLNELYLQHNNLSSLDHYSFAGLSQLRLLNLAHNRLTTLPSDFLLYLHRLEQLDLQHNALRKVDWTSLSLLSLRVLHLGDNQLRDLQLASSPSLFHLDLSGNRFESLPRSSLSSLASLEWLDLSRNSLFAVATGDISGLTRLSRLRITGCDRLRVIDRAAIASLPHLQVLELSGNPRLSFVDSGMLDALPALIDLQLHQNALRVIEQSLIASLPHLQKLSIARNPLWRCSCHNQWLLASNLTFSVDSLDAVQCAEPLRDGLCLPEAVAVSDPSLVVDEGDPARLECRAVGGRRFVVEWRRGNQTFEGNRWISASASLEDDGDYMCRARDNVTIGAWTLLQLRVRKRIVRIFPVAVTSKFLTVQWNGSEMSRVQRYLVIADTKGADKPETFVLHPYMRSYTVHHLLPQTEYRVCLGERNGKQEIQLLDCEFVTTKASPSSSSQSLQHAPHLTVPIILSLLFCTLLLAGGTLVLVRRCLVKHKSTYQDVDEAVKMEATEVTRLTHIPLTSLYKPLVTSLSSSMSSVNTRTTTVD